MEYYERRRLRIFNLPVVKYLKVYRYASRGSKFHLFYPILFFIFILCYFYLIYFILFILFLFYFLFYVLHLILSVNLISKGFIIQVRNKIGRNGSFSEKEGNGG